MTHIDEQKRKNASGLSDMFYIIMQSDNDLFRTLIFIGRKLYTHQNGNYTIADAAIKMLNSKYAAQNIGQLKHAAEKELIAISLTEFEEKTYAY